jgi:hypothetical protein
LYTRAGGVHAVADPLVTFLDFLATWLPVRFGGAKKDHQIAKGVGASYSTAGSFSDLAAAGVEATTKVPMRYFRHGSRSRPNTDAVIKLALVMLALGGQETTRRAFLRIRISLEPGSVFGPRAGIADRRWCLPNPSSRIATVEAELPIEAFIPPYLGRAI